MEYKEELTQTVGHEEQQRYDETKRLEENAELLGCSVALYTYIEALEHRIIDLENRLSKA